MRQSLGFTRIKRILVVEDDQAIRNTLKLLLESLGLGPATLSVSNGVEATRILASEEVDLLITDFQMPEMDGIELLNWCRSRQMHVPVIFISANAELVESEEIALKDCCATLMNKPMDMEAMIAAIEAAESMMHHPHCTHNRVTPV